MPFGYSDVSFFSFQPTAAPSHSPFDVVALYDFQGNKHDGELVFTSGETIHVTEKINDDWLRGETRGQTGVFPCNFVDISTDIINQLPVTVAKAAAAENGESAATDSERVLYCKGMFDYNSDVPSDLSFNTGDVIKVRKKVGDEWIEGELNGRVGMFPAAYVEIMEDTLGGQRGGCFNALPRINLFSPKSVMMLIYSIQ